MKYTILTPEKIADLTDNKEGLANKRAINKLYRQQDESHLWPILSRFNATERAIRNVREFQRLLGESLYGLEYCYAIEGELSRIVNGGC